jgi:hypothetical protein
MLGRIDEASCLHGSRLFHPTPGRCIPRSMVLLGQTTVSIPAELLRIADDRRGEE